MIRPVVAGIAALMLAGCGAPNAGQSPEVEAFVQEWAATYNTGDVDALAAMFSEDAWLLAPHAKMLGGPEGARAAFSGLMSQGVTAQVTGLESVAAGKIGYHVGTYVLTTRDGKELDRGKFMQTLRKDDRGWKIVVGIWNSDLPLKAGPVVVAVHEVEDLARWTSAWRDSPERREQFAAHGAAKVRLLQSRDHADRVGLAVEVADMDAFQAFLASEEASAAKAADGVKDATVQVYRELR